MWWGNSRSSKLLASCVLIHIFQSQATPAPHSNITAVNRHTHVETQSLTLSFSNSSPPAKRGALRTQDLGGGFLVQYVRFRSFARGPGFFLKLAYFWQYVEYKAMSAPNEGFNAASITFRWGDLRMEMFNLGGSVPREFVLAVANAMATYTARGFGGFFNARISMPGVVVWVTMRVDGD